MMFTPNELVFSFEGFYVCANFGEYPTRNASVRVHTDGHMDGGKLVL